MKAGICTKINGQLKYTQISVEERNRWRNNYDSVTEDPCFYTDIVLFLMTVEKSVCFIANV